MWKNNDKIIENVREIMKFKNVKITQNWISKYVMTICFGRKILAISENLVRNLCYRLCYRNWKFFSCPTLMWTLTYHLNYFIATGYSFIRWVVGGGWNSTKRFLQVDETVHWNIWRWTADCKEMVSRFRTPHTQRCETFQFCEFEQGSEIRWVWLLQ